MAAVCFNVKGPDLCFLDQPGKLEPADLEMYEMLGVPPTPFQNVRYFAPFTARGYALNTLRSHPALVDSVSPLTWGLGEVLQFAEVLLNKDDLDAKADALIDFIRERVVGKDFEEPGFSRTHRVQSFADLDAWFRDVLRKLEDSNGDTWRTHHAATVRKVRNRLSNLSTRCAGLVTDDGAVSDLPFGSFVDRAVYVVDVANVEEDAQDLVFARVVSRLREQLERRELGVDHVIVFVDELNKYAPHDGPDTYVRKMLLDIAERGRYLGLVLFGAQQFRSQVHRRVTGNAGTALYGRMDGEELASPGYQVLSPAIKARMATLDKGQLMVRHPHFTQPVFVRFPRPAVMSGREGVERFPQAPEPTLAQAVTRELRRLDETIDLGFVQHTILLYDEPVVLAARNAVMRTRPDDVKRAFVRELARRARPTASDVEAVTPRPRALRSFSPDEYGGWCGPTRPRTLSGRRASVACSMRLVHLSDLHLGFRQYQRLTPTGINQREADVAATVSRAVAQIIACAPDLIVVGGDVFHTVRPSNPAILHAFRTFSALRDRLPETPIVMVAGNHDAPRTSETGCILRLFREIGVHVADAKAELFTFAGRSLAVLAVPDVPGIDRPPFVPPEGYEHTVLLLHGEIAGMLPAHAAPADRAAIEKLVSECPGPQGDTYALERDRSGRHGRIMKYNLNKIE